MEMIAVQLPDHIEHRDRWRKHLSNELIKRLAATELHVRAEEVRFARNPYGKPYLPGLDSIQVNASHSGDWVIAAIHHCPIGVDIEQVRPILFEKVARRFFSNSEYEALLRQPESERLAYFYRLWTLKESYIKCIGRGLTYPLRDFAVSIRQKGISFWPSVRGGKFRFKEFPFDREYKVSACVHTDERTTESNAMIDAIRIVRFEELVPGIELGVNRETFAGIKKI